MTARDILINHLKDYKRVEEDGNLALVFIKNKVFVTNNKSFTYSDMALVNNFFAIIKTYLSKGKICINRELRPLYDNLEKEIIEIAESLRNEFEQDNEAEKNYYAKREEITLKYKSKYIKTLNGKLKKNADEFWELVGRKQFSENIYEELNKTKEKEIKDKIHSEYINKVIEGFFKGLGFGISIYSIENPENKKKAILHDMWANGFEDRCINKVLYKNYKEEN